MKTRIIIINIALSSLIAIGLAPDALAQLAQAVPQPTPRTDSVTMPVRVRDQQGTAELQEKVLTRINDGLFDGSLSVADASSYKTQLNKLNDQESWYKSFNSEIPSALTEKDTQFLIELSSKLQPKATLTASTANSLHGDVDELIQNALAVHHISSGDAERYYLRLAQIESNLESIKHSPGNAYGTMKANSELKQMKDELQRK